MMNLFHCLLGGILLGGGLLAAADSEVFPANMMCKYTRDADVQGTPAPVELTALGNESEAFQLIFKATADPLQVTKVAMSALDGPDGRQITSEAIQLRKAHYICCREFIKTPTWYPDALPAYGGESFTVAPGMLQSIYVDIQVPKDTPEGIYRGEITADVNGKTYATPVSVDVRPLNLPDTPTAGSAFPIWGGEQLAAPYGLAPDSPALQKLYERIYDFMLRYRLPPDDLPVPLDSPAAEKYLNNPVVNSFRIPYDPANPQRFVELCDWLRQKNLLDKGYVYTLDEPPRERYRECADYSDALHKLAPDVRFLLTICHGTAEELEGKVDIWCPVVAGYNPNYYQQRQARGEHVWWYTCVFPPPPYPGYFINDDGISPRMMSIFQAKYGIEGTLYWAINIWKKWDPVQEKYIERDLWNDPAAFPGANGDGYLIYPGETVDDDPVPTIRLEMIKQGQEDFDLLTMYKEACRRVLRNLKLDPGLAERRIFEVTNRSASDLASFNREIETLETMRLDVINELTAMAQGGPDAFLIASQAEGLVPKGTLLQWQVVAEPDCDVVVQAIDPVTGAELELTGDAAAFQLPVEQPVRLTVTVRKEGKELKLSRQYWPDSGRQRHETVFSFAEEYYRPWQDSAVTMFDLPGSVIKGFRFDTTTEFPNVRLKLTGDTAEYRWIQLTVSNPMTEATSAMLKLHGPRGAADGLQLQLEGQGRAVLAFPFNPTGTAPGEGFNELEIWMFRGRTANEIVIEQVKLFREKPEGDNLF